MIIVRPANTLARIGYAARLPSATHARREDVTYVQGKEVSVSGSAFWCSADGELYGPERHRTWRIERAAYSMMLPVSSPA